MIEFNHSSWMKKHNILIQKQNKLFNPHKHYGIDNNYTYFNNEDVRDIYFNWEKYAFNNILYIGDYIFDPPAGYHNVIKIQVYGENGHEIINIEGKTFEIESVPKFELQYLLMVFNIKIILFEEKYKNVANDLLKKSNYFVPIYSAGPESRKILSENIITITVYTLVFGQTQENFIEQSVISTLYQKSNIAYRIQYIFVIDPPYFKNDIKIEKILSKYQRYISDYKIIKNKTFENYINSYMIAISHIDGDYAINLDIDDISHPERFFWSIEKMRYKKNAIAISFVPLFFTNEIYFWTATQLESYRQAKNGDPYAVWILSNLFNNSQMGVNPQAWCVKTTGLKKILFDKKNLPNILGGGDRLILAEILYNYPLGVYNEGQALLFYRKHENSCCKTMTNGYYLDKSIPIDKQINLKNLLQFSQILTERNIKSIKKLEIFKQIKDYINDWNTTI